MAYNPIPKIDKEKIAQEKAKTAMLLPDNPSERGLTPSQIKQSLAHPLVASFSAINVLIGQLNDLLEDLENRVTTAESDLMENLRTCVNLNTLLESKINELEIVSHSHDNYTLLDTYTQTEENLKKAVETGNLLKNAELLSQYTNNNEVISEAISMINKCYYRGIGKRLVVIGDNLKTSDSNYNDFWQILANRMGFDSYDYCEANTETEFVGDVIIVSVGLLASINNLTIGNIDDTENTTFYGFLNQLITKLTTDNPYSRIVFVTPLQPYGYQVETYRNAIISKCLKHSIPVIDAYAISGIDLNIGQLGIEYDTELSIQKISEDGVHLNQRGHQLLADRLLTFIEKLI